MLHENLPKDLKEFVRNKIIKRILLFSGCVLAYSIILFFFGKVILHTNNIVSVFVLWLLGAALLAVILRLPTLLTDKMICGTIAKTIVKTQDSKALTAGLGSLKQKHVIDLIITSVDGKTHYKNVSTVESKAATSAATDRYKEGDTVFHLPATPHTIRLPQESDTSVPCAVCGRVNDKNRDTCESCAHTLIKSLCLFDKQEKE